MAPWSLTTFSTSERTSIRPHAELPANLPGLLSKSSYGTCAVSKKAGLADKCPRNLAAQWLIETADEAEHRWSTQNSSVRRMEYDSDSRKTGQGSPRPRASDLFAGLKSSKSVRIRSHEVLAYRITVGGCG